MEEDEEDEDQRIWRGEEESMDDGRKFMLPLRFERTYAYGSRRMPIENRL